MTAREICKQTEEEERGRKTNRRNRKRLVVSMKIKMTIKIPFCSALDGLAIFASIYSLMYQFF